MDPLPKVIENNHSYRFVYRLRKLHPMQTFISIPIYMVEHAHKKLPKRWFFLNELLFDCT